METFELILLAAAGLAATLFGYRIKKISFFAIWFLVGFKLLQFLTPTINSWVPQIADSELYQNLLPIAGGILMGFLGFTIEKLCISGICFALTIIIATHYFGTEMQTLAIAGIVGVILAGLAVILMKPATIIATSIAGAYTLCIVIFAFFAQLDQTTFYFPILAGISALGSLFQFITTKRK